VNESNGHVTDDENIWRCCLATVAKDTVSLVMLSWCKSTVGYPSDSLASCSVFVCSEF